jgi:hypothetical protein
VDLRDLLVLVLLEYLEALEDQEILLVLVDLEEIRVHIPLILVVVLLLFCLAQRSMT